MGSAHLRDLAVVEETTYEAVARSVVAVDAHNWLYRYLTTTVQFTDPDAYTTADGTAVPNVLGVVRGLPKLLENELLPAFVFDGQVVERKRPELDERRERKERAAEAAAAAREAGEEARARKLAARAQRLTPVVSETTRELLGLLDVPVVEAPAEGEAQAAHVARRGDADYVGTEDYDALLFGAPLTLRKLTSRDPPERMDLAATLARHDLTREQLVDVALLCGTDYNDGVHGYGPVTAVEAVREHGDLFGAMEAEDVTVEDAAAIRELFLDPEVTDDYAIDRTVAPDLERVREYVVEEWEIPADEVSTAFERLEACTPLSV